MKKIANKIAVGAIALVAFAGCVATFSAAYAKSEVSDCEQLQEQADEFRGNGVFYITGWQDEMCRSHGILINAPLK